MRIAMYYNRPFETGGIEKTMYERGKMLKDAGNEITYIYKAKDSQIDTLDKWSEVGNVICYEYLNDYFDVAIYDSIYNNSLVEASKYIQVINGNVIDGNENYIETIPFDEYIAVSEEASEQYEKKYHKKCKVIPNIIDADEIKKLAKEEYDLPKKKYNFVMVSRLDEQKGFDELEKVLLQIEEHTKDYQLVVVGSNNLYPTYGNKLKDRLKRFNIIWAGKQDNPYKYIYNADFFLHLSKYESQCMALFEAMILGVPCIVTDFDTAKKVITKENGLLIDRTTYEIDFKAITKLKRGYEYKYTNEIKKWLEAIKMPPKKDIKFSIIIPNYNNAKWLDKCLKSILNQTYKNYEIIFVDDVSTDNSIEIATNILKDVKDAKIIPLNRKRLNGGTRNVAIELATGDYILSIDSDDWLKHNEVLKMLNDKIRNQDVIFTGFDLFNGKEEGLFPFTPRYKNLEEAFKNDVCAIWTKVVKTSILKDTLFPEGTLMEDKVHNYRVIDKCKTFTCINSSTHVWNRSNTTSVTTKRNYKWNNSVYRHLAEMLDFIEETNNDKYKAYVKAKVNALKKEIDRGIYQQL